MAPRASFRPSLPSALLQAIKGVSLLTLLVPPDVVGQRKGVVRLRGVRTSS